MWLCTPPSDNNPNKCKAEPFSITWLKAPFNAGFVSNSPSKIAELPPVKENTNKTLELSPDEIAKITSVKLTNDTGSQLFTVTVRSLDKDLAERYIKEYVSQYKKFTAERLGRDNLSVVTEALGSNSPVYPVLWKNLLIATLVFTFLGFNFVFIKYLLSDSIDSYDDLEELVEKPVIGMIPTIEKKRKGE